MVVLPAFHRIIFLFYGVFRSTTSVGSIARVDANQRFARGGCAFLRNSNI